MSSSRTASFKPSYTGMASGTSIFRRPPMSKPVVLILTHPADVHADAVQAHLESEDVEVRRVDVRILGTSVAPVTAHIHDGTLVGDVAGVSLNCVVGVWHRRPSEFDATDA